MLNLVNLDETTKKKEKKLVVGSPLQNSLKFAAVPQKFDCCCLMMKMLMFLLQFPQQYFDSRRLQNLKVVVVVAVAAIAEVHLRD